MRENYIFVKDTNKYEDFKRAFISEISYETQLQNIACFSVNSFVFDPKITKALWEISRRNKSYVLILSNHNHFDLLSLDSGWFENRFMIFNEIVYEHKEVVQNLIEDDSVCISKFFDFDPNTIQELFIECLPRNKNALLYPKLLNAISEKYKVDFC